MLYPETKRHRMSDRVLKNLIAQFVAYSWDYTSFCWQGGEPTLIGLDFYRKVVKYQSLFGLSGQIVENSLQTNGILIDEEWAKFLARYRFLVGVSLDGPPELHDHYRKDHAGHFSYKRVMEGISWLRRYNVDFNILVLLNKRNIQRPKELYNFLISQGFRHLQFIPCVEREPEKDGLAEYSITPTEYGHFLCAVFDEWVREFPQVYVRDFDDLLTAYVVGEVPSCSFSSECGKYVVIEYNGDVYPCDFYVEPRWFLGNLVEQPLEKIFASEKFIEFSKRKGKLALECKGCPWVEYCQGGCPRHRTELGLKHNYFCPSYKIFFKHAHQHLLRLKRLVEKNRLVDITGVSREQRY